EGKPRLRGGPRAGDRLPDARVAIDERSTYLHEATIGPHLALLLCGDPDVWNSARLAALRVRHPDLLRVYHVDRRAAHNVLVDATGEAFEMLGVRSSAQYLIRPDGHVAFRCGGHDLGGLETYLTEWFPQKSGNDGAPRQRGH